jgi:UDP-2,3-diacylglucosamine pyrophosphatase LpxH
MPIRRRVEVLVLSDIHLGTYGCHAAELLSYLKSIKPETVILNGDIIDIWQFSKRFWPQSHMKIVKHIIGWVSKGIPVHYICGNHDEMLRKFEGFEVGSLSIKNKLILELDGKKAWFFHGDVFDVTMQHSKWLAKLGAVGYDTLILINTFVNFFSKLLGFGKLSFSKRIKNSVKGAVKFINNFEQTAANIAIEKEYDYVLCGHIHRPEKKLLSNHKGSVMYLNSGDWVENLTSLEYNNRSWSIHQYSSLSLDNIILGEDFEDEGLDLSDKSSEELFTMMFNDFMNKG